MKTSNADVEGTSLRGIVKGLPVPTVVVRRDGIMAFANARFARLTGYDLDELEGLNIQELLGSLSFAGVCATDIGSDGLELKLHRKDEHTVDVVVSASTIETPVAEASACLLLQFVDVDRPRSREAALIDRETRWSFALDSAGQGVWDHDLVADRVYHSPTDRKSVV